MASTLASEWTAFTTRLVGVEVTRMYKPSMHGAAIQFTVMDPVHRYELSCPRSNIRVCDAPEVWVDNARWTFSDFLQYFKPFSKHSGHFSWTGIKVTDVQMELQSTTAEDHHSNGPLKIELEWTVGPEEDSRVHKMNLESVYEELSTKFGRGKQWESEIGAYNKWETGGSRITGHMHAVPAVPCMELEGEAEAVKASDLLVAVHISARNEKST
ncbi:hypothetical protein R1sor_025729 [Riccia sorocarpa]|uniref:Uncharacterized protein n=1 Tax=Riccia sorocarpa TaxID=122646 RepID=A0ABD3GAX8_9MARC